MLKMRRGLREKRSSCDRIDNDSGNDCSKVMQQEKDRLLDAQIKLKERKQAWKKVLLEREDKEE